MSVTGQDLRCCFVKCVEFAAFDDLILVQTSADLVQRLSAQWELTFRLKEPAAVRFLSIMDTQFNRVGIRSDIQNDTLSQQ